MALLAQIREQLAHYDGRSVSMLSELTARYRDNASYIDAIVSLSADAEDNISDGATHMIKIHVDGGGALSAKQTGALVKSCGAVTSWQAQLHICQVIARLTLSASQAAALAPWLKPLLSHRRPFLRAWALDALCAIAQANDKFKKQALDALTAAENDKAASVRARARHISRSSLKATP